MPVSIDILMSTYNGERYIREQLDSLFSQTTTGWRLIIRDDGSIDGTCQIIFEYQKNNPGKILFIKDDERLGACQSFFRLMSYSNAQYIFFCDQDDVWLNNKIELQLYIMQKMERNSLDGCPVLVHSDLRVVDDYLELISESFWKYQKIKPKSMCGLNRALVQNYVTGCTMLVNKPLLECAKSGALNPIMHDWWMLLIATIKGKVVDMEKATVLYRQHTENDIGAVRWSLFSALKKLLAERGALRDSLLKTRMQAVGLLDSDILLPDESFVVKRYIELYEKKYCARRLELMRMRFFKHGILKNIAVFILI